MEKRDIIASIIEVANDLDNAGEFVIADELTSVGQRIASGEDIDWNAAEEAAIDMQTEQLIEEEREARHMKLVKKILMEEGLDPDDLSDEELYQIAHSPAMINAWNNKYN